MAGGGCDEAMVTLGVKGILKGLLKRCQSCQESERLHKASTSQRSTSSFLPSGFTFLHNSDGVSGSRHSALQPGPLLSLQLYFHFFLAC